MNARNILTLCLLCSVGSLVAPAQDPSAPESFAEAHRRVQQQLEGARKELASLRDRIQDEKLPLSRKLNDLESELADVRREYQEKTRTLDRRALDISELSTRKENSEKERSYLSNLLLEYLRNFESRLHIAEMQKYADALQRSKLAPDKSDTSELQVFETQTAMLETSLDRLEEDLSGTSFQGSAVVESTGLVVDGTFLLVGPVALFRSTDGQTVGQVEQRVNSLEPSVVSFPATEDARVAGDLVKGGEGTCPLDPTLGNARKIAATKETFWEHIQKGGLVMVPIFALAAFALLVALYKWLSLTFLPKPSGRRINELLQAVERRDQEAARECVASMTGPIGRMLATAVEHLREPRELIEEVMYEKILTARLKLQRFLPFIAIAAAAAPLLGLLGTVTGIINTFKIITVFGSGDVKSLSGGISEALITTKFGLIVAIPSLLLHAFLSRKARGVIGKMETTAVALVNQISRTPQGQETGPSHHEPHRVAIIPNPERRRIWANEPSESVASSGSD